MARRKKRTGSVRVTVTLPADLDQNLKRLSQKMGISKSALITSILVEALPDLERLVDLVPKEGDRKSLKRFRGQSIDLVMRRVGRALKDAL